MGSDSFFVVPDTTQLPIEGYEPAWIEVKRELRNYDLRVMQAAAVKEIRPANDATGEEQTWIPNLVAINESKALAWIVDWSLTDAKGKPVRFNRDGWRNLRPRVADAIVATLDAYTAAQEQETGENPTTADSPTSTLSSPSASGWADGVGMTSSELPPVSPGALSS